MALTDLIIKKMAPKIKRYEVFDGKNGLCIRVMPTGTKTWVFRYPRKVMRSTDSLSTTKTMT